ncbi:hypothetical protein [Acanthopleuribacter pedis]|uniref:Uncharacterized protein n=1 Tax=Acanthopleuribacter pedis TaxID=442870 RepID=A0A8J7Q6V5_9BACT|nr:hypothetical protein [Acanthopleuribacter pedis]MBO1321652.1 hypothetical protein [Acanthopleuribacter pedis]
MTTNFNWETDDDTTVDPADKGGRNEEPYLSWEPLPYAVTNFNLHKLVQVGPHRLEIRAGIAFQIFCLFFLLFPIVAALLSLAHADGPPVQWSLAFLPLAYTIAFFLWNLYGKPAVFDKDRDEVWRDAAFEVLPNALGKRAFHLKVNEVYALQLLYRKTMKQPSANVQLNIVSQTGDRFTLSHTMRFKTNHEIAEKLAQFLEVPLLVDPGLE